MKKIWIIAASLVLLIGIVWGATYLIQVRNYQNKVANLVTADLPFTGLKDGVYDGECDVRFIDAKVRVTVKDGRVADITILKHKNGHGAPAEAILGEIVQRQTLEVDAVSGATNSSRVLKKAVENALTQAEPQK